MARLGLMTILCFACMATALAAEEPDDQLARSLALVARDPTATLAARIRAVRMIGRLGPKSAAAVPDLTALLPQTRYPQLASLQEAIIDALGQIGASAHPALTALARESGRNTDIDLAVGRTVESILVASEQGDLNTLMRQIRHTEAGLRLRAAKTLGTLGVAARPALPLLAAALADEDADVRHAALAALRRVQPDFRPGEQEALAVALDLQDRDPAIRVRAIKTLASFGSAAASAIPALQMLLDDTDADVKRMAGELLNRIPPPQPVAGPAR